MSHPNSKTSVTIPQYILAPYVPTPPDVVERMLWLAQVTGDDLVYDLGCGDGRILIAAARQFGARGVGVEIEPFWVQESQRNAQQANLDHLLTFIVQDALTVDLSPNRAGSLPGRVVNREGAIDSSTQYETWNTCHLTQFQDGGLESIEKRNVHRRQRD
jgi:SAM-dependent methyltransferase